VFPNGEVIEKDRDDYDERVRTGLIGPDESASVEEALTAAQRAVAARAEPFDGSWLDWRPDPTWTVPSLPSGWATID
jgi:hypothetical protein